MIAYDELICNLCMTIQIRVLSINNFVPNFKTIIFKQYFHVFKLNLNPAKYLFQYIINKSNNIISIIEYIHI